MKCNRNIIYLKRPASIEQDMWKDALPIGDGISGALIWGAIAEETILFTRYDLWQCNRKADELPDISECLSQMRKEIDLGNYHGANDIMYRKLMEHHQNSSTAPFPLGMFHMNYIVPNGVAFRHYRRGIDMSNASAFVQWEDQNGTHQRTCFVSQADGIFYCDIQCTAPVDYILDFGMYKPELELAKEIAKETSGTTLKFCASVSDTELGTVMTVQCNDPNGTCSPCQSGLAIHSSHFTIKIKTFAKQSHEKAFPMLAHDLSFSDSFISAYQKHTKIFQEKFNCVSIELTKRDDATLTLSNRALLDLAYEDTAPTALFEKLWRFARYLFLSGTTKGGNPFSLYGIWFGDYNLCWASNVCNENIEMIYWQVLTGGMAESLEDFIHYFYQKMPACRNLAKQMFGCRGIFLPAYTHPETIDGKNTTEISPTVPVICNWISGAGWVSLHFYQYYQYTHNTDLLNSEILPYMIEAARFYSDYVVFDEAGKVRIYPSVSPENTPGNLMPKHFTEDLGHVCPVTENATMDLAVIKSLLTHLLSLLRDSACTVRVPDAERIQWERILKAIPNYITNSDGAIQEWTTTKLTDFYPHRHFSHLFPLFPGDEVSFDSNPNLIRAFQRAIELRPHGAQSGWSFAHVAEIWAKLGNGEKAMENLDFLVKGCVLDNFFTLHNDWRHMGASVVMDNICPVQLDALMGYASTIQDMLLQYHNGHVFILPALPKRLSEYIRASNLQIPEGRVSIELDNGTLTVELNLISSYDLTIHIGKKAVSIHADDQHLHFSFTEKEFQIPND